MTIDHTRRPLVVCPLEFERRSLRRHGLSALTELHCCGPGDAGVRRWARDVELAPGRVVILAGLAGGLDREARVGTAWLAESVVDASGEGPLAPTWPRPAAAAIPAARLVSVTRPVIHPDDKRRLHERSGAALVDVESAAFARVAGSAGWSWGIVRGVSDDVDTSLPDGIERWVSASGRPRPGVIIGALARRPGRISSVRRLHRDGGIAMAAVAELLRRLVRGTPPGRAE